jgi:dephospho-CoA kinase
MNKVVAIVGMAGAGKSEVAQMFEAKGFARIRFGDITDIELKKRGMEINEENERYCRERLREDHGMAAYALLNQPRINKELKKSNVVLDGLYSWEEYLSFKDYYKEDFFVVAVYASPLIRHERLGKRKVRPLTPEEAQERDKSEIENLNKGGPIAVANYTIINEQQIDYLRLQTEVVIGRLNKI